VALIPHSALSKDKTSGKGELQHRHFATIAAILAELGPNQGVFDNQRQGICEHFADHLADTNPRFDRARFLVACGAKELADL